VRAGRGVALGAADLEHYGAGDAQPLHIGIPYPFNRWLAAA
jgi:hypothetical protein